MDLNAKIWKLLNVLNYPTEFKNLRLINVYLIKFLI